MKTIGPLLKKRRRQLKISLDEVEGKLRIRKKYLIALEENNFKVLPSANYIKGFVHNYSRYLGLDEDKVLALFRRQYTQIEAQKIVYKGVTAPLDRPMIRITPQKAAILAGLVVMGIFFFFLFRQLRTLTGAPALTIIEPENDIVVSLSSISIKGKVSPGAQVYINTQAAEVGKKGEFNKKYDLKEGANEILIEAVGQSEKKTTKVIKVRYKPN